jgi:hypothetical protein
MNHHQLPATFFIHSWRSVRLVQHHFIFSAKVLKLTNQRSTICSKALDFCLLMSDRHAASNIISIASLDGDRKEPCGRYIFSRPDQASRDAVPKLISSKRSAAPLKKGLVHHSSFDDSNHASPLVTYHKERPSNDSWYPIPFVTSPKEDNMIMSGVMEDFKRLMHGAFSEAKELPGRDSPSDIDVLCPKGGGNNVVAHPGNKYYSKLIEETVEHIYDKPDEDPDIVDAVSESPRVDLFLMTSLGIQCSHIRIWCCFLLLRLQLQESSSSRFGVETANSYAKTTRIIRHGGILETPPPFARPFYASRKRISYLLKIRRRRQSRKRLKFHQPNHKKPAGHGIQKLSKTS